MKILRASLYEAERDKQLQERAEDRKDQVDQEIDLKGYVHIIIRKEE